MSQRARLHFHWIVQRICNSVLMQPGIIAGDIYVRIKIKRHPFFDRRGADILHVKKITLL